MRATGAACVLLLLAGVVGLVAHGSRSGRRSVLAAGPPTTTGIPTSSSTTAPDVTDPSGVVTPSDEATLQTDLLVANDLGGYYTSIPADSALRLAGSGCLAGLGLPPGGRVRAVQYLQGPFGRDLPDIDEQLTSYPNVARASAAFAALSAILAGCPSTTLDLAAGPASATLGPLAVAGLGDQSSTAQGPFRLGALVGKVTVSVVRSSTTIVVFVFADRTPPSLAILGSQQSTLRAAVGKASP